MWNEPTAAKRVVIEATAAAEVIAAIGVVGEGAIAVNGEMTPGARWASRGRPRNHIPKTTSLRAKIIGLEITTFARARPQDAG